MLFLGILNWARKNLTRKELIKFLLATANEGRTVFNVAKEFCKLGYYKKFEQG